MTNGVGLVSARLRIWLLGGTGLFSPTVSVLFLAVLIFFSVPSCSTVAVLPALEDPRW